NNALVMVDRLNRTSAGEDSSEFVERLIESVTTRLRPVLLTTVTTVSALLPLAYGLGGSDVGVWPFINGLRCTVFPALLLFDDSGNDILFTWARLALNHNVLIGLLLWLKFLNGRCLTLMLLFLW
ncbi:efflux RND transporter permease subunit, partial [Endozoicomonas sp.]|uniref:efflux RND transporter permease subunit n=1 Tax=Endozoicomonas sp. TaxID=1892382 RepID=UPI00383BEDF0